MDNKKINEAELTEKELTKKGLTDKELEQVSGGDFNKQKVAEILRQRNNSKDNK